VPDADDQDEQPALADLVEHAVVADADAPEVFLAREFL
jgi:hypothetical protein